MLKNGNRNNKENDQFTKDFHNTRLFYSKGTYCPGLSGLVLMIAGLPRWEARQRITSNSYQGPRVPSCKCGRHTWGMRVMITILLTLSVRSSSNGLLSDVLTSAGAAPTRIFQKMEPALGHDDPTATCQEYNPTESIANFVRECALSTVRSRSLRPGTHHTWVMPNLMLPSLWKLYSAVRPEEKRTRNFTEIWTYEEDLRGISGSLT